MGCKPDTHVTSGLILLSSLNTKERKQTLLPEQKNARHGKTSFIFTTEVHRNVIHGIYVSSIRHSKIKPI